MRTSMVVVACLSGCSFVELRVPTSAPIEKVLECPRGLPITDTVIGIAGFALAAAVGINAAIHDSGASEASAAYVALFVAPPAGAIGIGYSVSAIWGWGEHDRCVQLRDGKR